MLKIKKAEIDLSATKVDPKLEFATTVVWLRYHQRNVCGPVDGISEAVHPFQPYQTDWRMVRFVDDRIMKDDADFRNISSIWQKKWVLRKNFSRKHQAFELVPGGRSQITTIESGREKLNFHQPTSLCCTCAGNDKMSMTNTRVISVITWTYFRAVAESISSTRNSLYLCGHIMWKSWILLKKIVPSATSYLWWPFCELCRVLPAKFTVRSLKTGDKSQNNLFIYSMYWHIVVLRSKPAWRYTKIPRYFHTITKSTESSMMQLSTSSNYSCDWWPSTDRLILFNKDDPLKSVDVCSGEKTPGYKGDATGGNHLNKPVEHWKEVRHIW